MRYFIPAWYSGQKLWKDNTLPFYYKPDKTDFDDMISLMSMHKKNGYEYKLLVLNYSPNLRLFLHRHDLFESDYWSVFDVLQSAPNTLPRAIDYLDLNWPKDTEFVYSPFMVEAVIGKNTYSQITFNQEGYVLHIHEYENGLQQQKIIFDDRGFISSIIKYENDTEVEQTYLNVLGEKILTENLITGEVLVNNPVKDLLDHSKYLNMLEIIEEIVEKFYTDQITQSDDFIAASDGRHNQLITRYFEANQLCFSLFSNRNREITSHLIQSMQPAKSCLVDTKENERECRLIANNNSINMKMSRITPFDTEKIPNISSQLYDVHIGFWIDNLSRDVVEPVIDQLYSYIKNKENYRVTILMKDITSKTPKWLSDIVKGKNELYNEEQRTLSEEMADVLEEEMEFIEIIKIESVIFEEDLIRAMSQLRVVIDLGDEPDLYLQISAISAGVPQINMIETDYVTPNVNGLIIPSSSNMIQALDYFLLSLKNWNYSYASSLKLVDEFSSTKIIREVNRLIKGELYG
ncbi:accessory Sec system protein Asp1 [Staphylococcus warneri]|uniref:accessory Sec system protein Asp1 n=2 Tax=Staphylococcus warneri TaxID=1292 RepID=UPI0005E41900|nr:accessory Sec system protein Asp1 [Staphylococcus warneri]HER6579571.1 accessory Sec system protein Asp1 [Streptococcus pyogenes]KTW06299.1 accessory Sec system protein Asp1 [Staphylococcus warneri]KTW25423.1 accessory Sec system protein Asp1 [Staphylococcus warneri]MCG7307832.1 accessory Sec system protein Asp1 [Staphylococcus warneri]MEC0621342.1 accessory Sec system protein Asp1 [Staphylococcus warneri]